MQSFGKARLCSSPCRSHLQNTGRGEGSLKLTRKEKRNIIWLAYFVRYGYWVLYILGLHILGEMNAPRIPTALIRSGMLAFFGLYHLIGLHFRFRHLYCAMQEAYYEKMTPQHFSDFTRKMKKDIRFIGWFFLLGGSLLELAFSLGS